MGRQRGFYAVEEDQQALLDIAHEAGLRAVQYLTPIGNEPQPVSLTEFRMPDGQHFFYLVPDGVPREALRFRPMADGRHQRVDDFESAAIELAPSQRRGDKLVPGRIYLFTSRQRPWAPPTRRAYERLARYLGTWPETTRYHFRVGPAAAEAVRAGRLRLCQQVGDEQLMLDD